MLFGAQAASAIGDGAFTVALAFAVLRLTHSPRDLGLVISAQTVPMLIFILAGGVLADRGRRERLMVGADLLRVCSQATMAVLLVGGAAQLWQLIALQLVNGTAIAIFRPASGGLLPQTVPPEQLQPANALFTMATSASTVVGPALGGVLVVTVGAGWAVGLDALSFAVSAAFLSQLSVPQNLRSARKSFMRDVAEGWDEVRSRSWILAMLLVSATFQIVVGALLVVGPLVADRSLGGATVWGFFMAAYGAGFFLGGVIALRVRPRRPLVTAFVLITAVIPAPVLLALGAAVPLTAAAFLVAGAMPAFGDTVWLTTLQSKVPQHALSRVTSFVLLGTRACFPIGLIAAGAIASAIGAAPALLGAAAMLGAASLLALLVPDVRRLTLQPAVPDSVPHPNDADTPSRQA